MEVTVSSLDISEVNSLMLEDSVSSQGIIKMAVRFALGGSGGLLGSLGNLVVGDMSFILDEFMKKAPLAQERNSCTGEIELKYDKE